MKSNISILRLTRSLPASCHTCCQFLDKRAQRQNLVLFWWNELRELTAASTRFIKTTPDSVLGHFCQGTGNTYEVTVTNMNFSSALYIDLDMEYLISSFSVRLVLGPHLRRCGGETIEWRARRFISCQRLERRSLHLFANFQAQWKCEACSDRTWSR